MNLDATDLKILDILKADARIQWKEIGSQVHLTGQAVAGRIQKMRETGVIRGFSVLTDPAKLGYPITFYVTVFMKTNDHASFRSFVEIRSEIIEAHRTSGGGCYLLKAKAGTNEDMNNLLDAILPYGNYAVSLSIGQVK